MSSDAFREYRLVGVVEDLRQGDVLEAVDPAADQWKRHLVVITADCDLAQKKNHGRITCVPLLTGDEYLREFQVPKIIEKAIAKCSAELHALLKRIGAPNVSDGRLRAWPLEESPEVIASVLSESGADKDTLAALFGCIRIASTLPEKLDAAVTALVEAQTLIPNAKKKDTLRREILQTLSSPFQSSPGDALFISSIGPQLEEGYFVYLRHLEQVHPESIALTPSRAKRDYRRISRIQDRYIHAIAQQFGLVFMAIGLPKAYEDTRSLHLMELEERCS